MEFEQLRQVIADQLGTDAESITPDSTFAGDLGADSLDMVELMMAIEEKIGVHVEDADAKNLRTVADALRYIAAHK